jgi:nickel/cobalt exporter
MQSIITWCHRQTYRITLLCFVALAALLVVLYLHWHQVLWQMLQLQNSLHRDMAVLIRAVAGMDSVRNTSLFLLLCFGYGVFHAVGPGHGKTILTTYLATHNSQLRKAMWISFGAAIIQGVIAILLILVFSVLLHWTRFDTNYMGQQLDLASFWLVILLGLYICCRAAYQGFQQFRHRPKPVFTEQSMLQQPVTLTKVQLRPYSCIVAAKPAQPVVISCSCGHTHAPKHDQLGQASSGWAMIALMITMGLRPCTGSLLVLVLAKALGMLKLGIASVFVMSLGTGLTICLMAWISYTMRHLALTLLGKPTRKTALVHLGMTSLSFVGGIILISFGYGMMMLAHTQVSPFFRPY